MNICTSFQKLQGLGNDFVVIDDLDRAPGAEAPLTAALARAICDRRFGVGADQILWLKRPQGSTADVRMEIWNADGSTAEMCGNGIRAVALHMHKTRGDTRLVFNVETLGGLKRVELRPDLATAVVDMGPPQLGAGFTGDGAGEYLRFTSDPDLPAITFFEVSMGNPHAVIFVDDVSSYPVALLGPQIEKHERFPKKTNVEFVQVNSLNEVRVRVWERGAGETLACGTGACAVAVAALQTGRVTGAVDVLMPGGKAILRWNGPGHGVFLEGPIAICFKGELDLRDFGARATS